MTPLSHSLIHSLTHLYIFTPSLISLLTLVLISLSMIHSLLPLLVNSDSLIHSFRYPYSLISYTFSLFSTANYPTVSLIPFHSLIFSFTSYPSPFKLSLLYRDNVKKLHVFSSNNSLCPLNLFLERAMFQLALGLEIRRQGEKSRC